MERCRRKFEESDLEGNSVEGSNDDDSSNESDMSDCNEFSNCDDAINKDMYNSVSVSYQQHCLRILLLHWKKA